MAIISTKETLPGTDLKPIAKGQLLNRYQVDQNQGLPWNFKYSTWPSDVKNCARSLKQLTTEDQLWRPEGYRRRSRITESPLQFDLYISFYCEGEPPLLPGSFFHKPKLHLLETMLNQPGTLSQKTELTDYQNIRYAAIRPSLRIGPFSHLAMLLQETNHQSQFFIERAEVHPFLLVSRNHPNITKNEDIRRFIVKISLIEALASKIKDFQIKEKV